MKLRTPSKQRRFHAVSPSGVFALFSIALTVAASIVLSSCSGYTSAASGGGGQTGDPPTGILTANPTSLSFGNVAVGSTATQNVSVTNTGTAAVNISQSTIVGTGFTVVSGGSGVSVPVGQSATVEVQFAPTAGTTDSGTLTVSSNASDSALGIALSGTGTQAQISASPSSVSFGNVAMGSNSSTQVTLKNNGSATLSISQITVAGAGMSQTGLSTSTTISAGGSVAFNAIFAPTSTAAVNGSITLATNGSPSSLVINLTGTGTGNQPQISANPSSVSFGTVTVGNTNSQQIMLTNNGNATLTFSQITVTGTGFSQTGLSTSTTIAAGGNATFDAVFTPASATSVNGSIVLTTNGTPSPLTIGLSGTGSSAVLDLGTNPSSLSFGNVNDGTNSSQTVTLTNNGNSNITISSVTVSGAGFSASGVSNGTVLTPNQTATLTVTFAPVNPGAVTGASVTIASNATNSPTNVTLSGTGTHSVLLQWSASTTQGVTYNVFRATTANGYGTTPLNPSPISGTSYTDTNVTSGQQYFYVVQAVNSAGSSGDSSPANVTIPTP
jgi:Abnormal spindle-like microcephaly-assoc'd, ASPM-SPD-2-Hydin/Fibronectin type III domain